MEKLSFVIENQLGVAKDNEELKNKLKEFRVNMKKKFIEDNAEGVEL